MACHAWPSFHSGSCAPRRCAAAHLNRFRFHRAPSVLPRRVLCLRDLCHHAIAAVADSSGSPFRAPLQLVRQSGTGTACHHHSLVLAGRSGGCVCCAAVPAPVARRKCQSASSAGVASSVAHSTPGSGSPVPSSRVYRSGFINSPARWFRRARGNVGFSSVPTTVARSVLC